MFDRRQLCVVCLTTFFTLAPAAWAQSNQSDAMGRPGQSTTNDQSTTSGQTTTRGTGSTSGQANTTSESTTTGEERDQAELARKAADVLREITQAPDKAIPTELLEEAKGIAVIPNVIKGAFIVGGRWGEGLMLGRGSDGSWNSNPSFIEISGASVGFQVGVESTDLLLVFTSKDSIDALLDGKLKLGGEAAVAAGPVGRQAGASTDIKASGPIYSYSRNKGVFAGVSLDGAVISIDDSANQKVYGQGTTGTQLLRGEMGTQASTQAAPVVQPFVEAVRTNTGAKAE